MQNTIFHNESDKDLDRANRSIYLYKKLLTFTKELKEEYLKNVENFENHLIFNDVSESCYRELYSSIRSPEEIKSLSHYYETIPELKELNAKAIKFFLKPRNKSVKGLDVQLGNKYDEIFINFLRSQGIKAERADLKNKSLPDIMILDSTRNIKAYIEHKYHHAPFMLSHNILKRESYEGSITLDTKKLNKQIIEVESSLEGRPVFVVHWVDFHHLKGIFFNTLEQIKQYLDEDSTQFVRKDRPGDYKLIHKKKLRKGYLEKFYPPLHEMGDFAELIEYLSPNVKKN
jgi:hypothetical protein